MLDASLYRLVNDLNGWRSVLDAFSQHLTTDGSIANKWIFRGQKWAVSQKSDLATSLERATGDASALDGFSRADIERKLAREFRRKLNHYFPGRPEIDNKLELIALMQHHGAPTRLHDWTYSMYVALFFAVEVPSDRYRVWALNPEWFCAERVLGDKAAEIRENAKNRAIQMDWDVPTTIQQHIIDYLAENSVPGVHNVNPYWLNERLTIQQGVFLYPGDVNQSLEANLSASDYNSRSADFLFCFEIDGNARRGILGELQAMNMNGATLYPGIDGFSKSLWTKAIFPATMG